MRLEFNGGHCFKRCLSSAAGRKSSCSDAGYYSDYTRLSEKDAAILRRCNDFMIRYLDLFYDEELRNVSMTHMGWDNYEYQCQSHPVSTYGEANKLWLTIREKGSRKCLYFVNLCGCEDDYWNRGKDTPIPQENIRIVVQVDSPVKGVYAASPDGKQCRLRQSNILILKMIRGHLLNLSFRE